MKETNKKIKNVINHGIWDWDKTQRGEREREEIDREIKLKFNTDRTFGAPLITVVAPTSPVSSYFDLLLPSTWSSFFTFNALFLFFHPIINFLSLFFSFIYYFLNFHFFGFWSIPICQVRDLASMILTP